VTVNQIQEWEQENPDDIDEVPVKTDEVYRRVVLGGI
jgi:hypothetical protein